MNKLLIIGPAIEGQFIGTSENRLSHHQINLGATFQRDVCDLEAGVPSKKRKSKTQCVPIFNGHAMKMFFRLKKFPTSPQNKANVTRIEEYLFDLDIRDRQLDDDDQHSVNKGQEGRESDIILSHRGIPNELTFKPPSNCVIIEAQSLEQLKKRVETLSKHPDASSSNYCTMGVIGSVELAASITLKLDTSYEAFVASLFPVDPKLRLDYQPDKDKPSRLPNYLIVRIGSTAALLIDFLALKADDDSDAVWLFYHRQRPAPILNLGLGRMFGYSQILCWSLCRAISANGLQSREVRLDEIKVGIKRGIAACFTYFCEGLPASLFQNGDSEKNLIALFQGLLLNPTRTSTSVNLAELLDDKVQSVETEAAKKCVKEVLVPLSIVQTPNHHWRISLNEDTATLDENLVIEKCLKYINRKDKDPDSPFPEVSFGEVTLVDRLEIEDYLYLNHQFANYGNDSSKKPISIAVFGAPGAGKSYGVTQLFKHLSDGGGNFAKEKIEFNLSQFQSAGELAEAFHVVRDACLAGPIPLIFFDEFDASFDGVNYGWLKYFLAPMLDGKFMDRGRTYHLGKAVFVFAGGINATFHDLKGQQRKPEFCEAKGPDFISRLRGTLNIRGISKPEDGADLSYMLRRAAQLRRGLIKKFPRGMPGAYYAEPYLSKALLTIDRLRHGSRSLDAILQMCRSPHDRPLSETDLPSRDQLDLHVDARSFLRKVSDGRAEAVQ